jgi:hypothetical protein
MNNWGMGMCFLGGEVYKRNGGDRKYIYVHYIELQEEAQAYAGDDASTTATVKSNKNAHRETLVEEGREESRRWGKLRRLQIQPSSPARLLRT